MPTLRAEVSKRTWANDVSTAIRAIPHTTMRIVTNTVIIMWAGTNRQHDCTACTRRVSDTRASWADVAGGQQGKQGKGKEGVTKFHSSGA